MNHLGEKIRQVRESKGLLLRQVAAFIEVDTAFLSKMERGERKPKREQVIKLAGFLKTPESDLLVLWMADRIIETITDKNLAAKAIEIVKKDIKQ
jgi:HTH-type transcriptional regulator, competence development regulator